MGFVEKMVETMKQVATNTKEETSVEAETNETSEAPDSGADENVAETSESETSDTEEKLYSDEDVKKLIDDNKKAWEMEKLSTMSKDEQIHQLKEELLKRDLQDKVIKRLEEERLPLGVSEFVKYTDEKQTFEHLEHVIETTKNIVTEGVRLRLHGKTPEGLGGSGNPQNDITDHFAHTFEKAMKK